MLSELQEFLSSQYYYTIYIQFNLLTTYEIFYLLFFHLLLFILPMQNGLTVSFTSINYKSLSLSAIKFFILSILLIVSCFDHILQTFYVMAILLFEIRNHMIYIFHNSKDETIFLFSFFYKNISKICNILQIIKSRFSFKL